MDIRVILYILINLMLVSVSFANVLPSTLSHTEIMTVDKNCPNLTKGIHSNNITKYTSNCEYSSPKGGKITEENVLRYACHVVETIMIYICDRFKVPSEYLNLQVDSKTLICPFDFTELKKLKDFPANKFNNSFEQVLVNKNYCEKVCYDLSEPENQCVVLSKVVKYLNDVIKLSEANSFNQDKSKQIVGVSENASKQESIQGVEEHRVQNMAEDNIQGMTNSNGLQTSKFEDQVNEEESIQGTRNNEEDLIQKKTESIEQTTLAKVKSSPLSTGENSKDENKNYGVGSAQVNKDEDIQGMGDDLTQKKMESSSPGVPSSLPKAKSPDLSIEEAPKDDTMDYGLEDDSLKTKNEDLGISFDDPDNFKPDLNQMSSSSFEQKEPPLQESSSHTEIYSGEKFFQAEESHFFFYFLMLSSVVVIGYLAFHNKNKILAYALEGSNSRRNRRRPNPARYRKLECNLEEAISSNAPQTASNVVY